MELFDAMLESREENSFYNPPPSLQKNWRGFGIIHFINLGSRKRYTFYYFAFVFLDFWLCLLFMDLVISHCPSFLHWGIPPTCVVCPNRLGELFRVPGWGEVFPPENSQKKVTTPVVFPSWPQVVVAYKMI